MCRIKPAVSKWRLLRRNQCYFSNFCFYIITRTTHVQTVVEPTIGTYVEFFLKFNLEILLITYCIPV